MGEISVSFGMHETDIWQRGSHSWAFPVALQNLQDQCKAHVHLQRCRHVQESPYATLGSCCGHSAGAHGTAWTRTRRGEGSKAAHPQAVQVGRTMIPAVWKHAPIHKQCLQMQLLHLILQMEHRQTEAIAVHAPGQHEPSLLPNPGTHSHPCNTYLFSKVSARMVRLFSSPSGSFLAVQFCWSLLVWVNSTRIYTFELR